MDETEQHAERYLKRLFGVAPIYEPEGYSKPPDFLVDGRIAVEVRRLNQRLSVKQEDALNAFGFRQTVETALSDLGAPVNSACWYVFVEFRRPVPIRSKVSKRIRQKLRVLPQPRRPFSRYCDDSNR